MAVQKSTKWSNTAVQNSVKSSPVAMYTLLQLRIFSGSPPATADAAETGTLLCVITEPSYAALTWLDTAAAAGVMSKTTNVWAGVAGDTNAGTGSSATTKITSGTGVAGYFRYCTKADTGALDTTTYPRLQGVCNQSGGELVLSSTTLTFGATTTISSAAMSITPN